MFSTSQILLRKIYFKSQNWKADSESMDNIPPVIFKTVNIREGGNIK